MHPLHELSLDELRRRTSMKWTAYGPDVLPLWVAEMDVRLAEPIERALVGAIRAGDTGYPGTTNRYAEAYASFAADRWGWTGAAAAPTALVADVMVGVFELIRLVSEPGDVVVVDPPVYPPFYGFTEHAGRSVLEAPLGDDGRLDLEAVGAAFEQAGAGGGRVTYLLCNPHNPTGTVHTRAELEGVARLAREQRVRVVVDEIHSPLAAEGFVPYLSVEATDDAYVVVSASKAWNLAGAKAALVVGGPGTAAELAGLHEMVSHGPSHLGVLAHTAALEEGRDWLDALHADLADNRRLLADLVAEHLPEARAFAGPGTYLAWLDCRDLGLGDDLATVFVERGRVALNDGRDFGRGAGHVRLNYATSPEVLTEAVRRMASAARP